MIPVNIYPTLQLPECMVGINRLVQSRHPRRLSAEEVHAVLPKRNHSQDDSTHDRPAWLLPQIFMRGFGGL